MTRHAWFGAVAAALMIVALVATGAARAERGPIQLVSKDAGEQADSASEPAISGAGKYVAFLATIGGRRGIFRKDLETGELVPVATGSAYFSGDLGGSASNPSISADGRYVSFTTAAPLDPADDGVGSSDSDVYVADMNTTPPTYELASARDGCVPVISPTPCGLTYEGNGSVSAGRVALSADGREVAFVVSGKSDLMDAPGQVETPAGQVLVRNLETDRTILVSAERDPLTGAMTGDPVEGGAVASGFGTGASLSADGNTVAWYGGNLPAQVPVLGDEREAMETTNGALYGEPLWRPLPTAADPTPPTRRIVGGGDPLAPGCPVSGTLGDPTCDGPYPDLFKDTGGLCGASPPGWLNAFAADGLPQLSADGRTVALIGEPNGFANVFLVNMAEGLTRSQALLPLTSEVPIEEPCHANSPEYVAGAGTISDIAISPDGNRVAFVTVRQQFPLSPPHLITQLPGKVGETESELYLVDLTGHTIERLTPANLAEASRSSGKRETGGASSPSFSADGMTLAFSSTASNLVAGDANEERDVFVVTDSTPPVVPGTTSISGSPSKPEAKRRWRLTASAVSLSHGRVKVRALVPGPGRLLVKARAAVGARLDLRQVAIARGSSRNEGLMRLTLRLKRGYARLAHGRGLTANCSLSFKGPGGAPLHFQLGARFATAPGKRKPRRGKAGQK